MLNALETTVTVSVSLFIHVMRDLASGGIYSVLAHTKESLPLAVGLLIDRPGKVRRIFLFSLNIFFPAVCARRLYNSVPKDDCVGGPLIATTQPSLCSTDYTALFVL
jgi:hypothetical protein